MTTTTAQLVDTVGDGEVRRQTVACPEPGVYRDIPHDEYLAWDALSNSVASRFWAGEREGAAYQRTPNSPPSWNLRLGTALHMSVLEPGRCGEHALAVPQFDDPDRPALKSGKRPAPTKLSPQSAPEVWLAAERAFPGKLVIPPAWFPLIGRMTEAVRSHPAASALVSRVATADREVSLVWDDPDLGCRCKARPDMQTSETSRSVVDFGYARQAAFYLRGATQLGVIDPANWRLVFVQSAEPHEVTVVRINRESIEYAWAEVEIAAGRYRRWCDGQGPAWRHADTVEVALPKWAVDEGLTPTSPLLGGAA